MPKTLILTDGESRAASERRLTRVVRPLGGLSLLTPRSENLFPTIDHKGNVWWFYGNRGRLVPGDPDRSPFGPTGGVLAARTPWYHLPKPPCNPDNEKAWDEFTMCVRWPTGEEIRDCHPHIEEPWKKRGASTMPAWASRFSLRIVAQRPCQVRELNWVDCIGCGMKDPRRCAARIDINNPKSPVYQFREEWSRRYAKRPALAWELNPFVAVAEVEIEIKEKGR